MGSLLRIPNLVFFPGWYIHIKGKLQVKAMFKRFLMIGALFAIGGTSAFAREPREVRESNTKALFQIILSLETAASDVSRMASDNAGFYRKRAVDKLRESLRLFDDIDHKIAGNLAKEIRADLESVAGEIGVSRDTRLSPKVIQDLRTVNKKVITAFQVETAPALVPDYELGQKTYATTCAGCHGATGDGQGPLVSAKMQPKPSSHLDATFMDALSPFRIFHVLSVGMDAALMPSFSNMLTVEQRWAVAFYVAQMRYPRAELPASDQVSLAAKWDLDLKKISWLTDGELREYLASMPASGVLKKQDPVAVVRSQIAFYKNLPRSGKGATSTVPR
jgi:mono/diheme cytochrome c family protein